jgi:hypothetical protein
MLPQNKYPELKAKDLTIHFIGRSGFQAGNRLLFVLHASEIKRGKLQEIRPTAAPYHIFSNERRRATEVIQSLY